MVRNTTWARRGLAVAGLGLAGAAAVRWYGRRRVSRLVDRRRRRLRDVARGREQGSEPYDPANVADLPAPARRYFETVLEPGQAPVTSVTLEQVGEFRLGGADAAWHSLRAMQVYTVDPPGYVWDAEIAMAPFVSARVVDAYVDGEGTLLATLLGTIPVARAGPDPAMNEAELQRFLSEAPWFPTALLPSAGVTWEALDDERVRATLSDGEVTASAVFHVDADGFLTRLTADRYRQEVAEVAPWSGTYSAYEERNGIVIPTEAEVGWGTGDGRGTIDGYVPYWRGTITEIEHRTD